MHQRKYKEQSPENITEIVNIFQKISDNLYKCVVEEKIRNQRKNITEAGDNPKDDT